MLRRAVAIAGVLAAVSLGMPGTAHADQARDLEQPVLDELGVPGAWNSTRGEGVTVAVLDSGVDPTVQDLTGKVTTGPDYAKGADPHGVSPKRLHGTNMASIIAGHGHGPGGASGMIGVAPDAKILSVRVILEKDEPGFATYTNGSRFSDTIPKGIRYAADHGAGVINLSVGRRQPSTAERQAIAYAVSKGVVVVASAGNDGEKESGSSVFSYPASYPGVISVAAVDSSGRRAPFSDRNGAVAVSAPGVDIIGAGPGDTYWHGDGTSPAAAFVSGIAALVRAKYPRLAPGLVAQAIASGTTSRPSGGYDGDVGFGVVNATAALQAARNLAAIRLAGSGLDQARRFVPDAPSAVQIVHHDRSLLATYSGIGTVGLLGLLGSAVALAARRRRYPAEQDRGSFPNG